MRRKTRTPTEKSAKRGTPRPSSAPVSPLSASRDRCPIVAIGASSGGLEAFLTFFEHMPKGSGMAFVLIQHLDPNHETLMPELLAKHTAMPVKRVEKEFSPQPETIYVVPPTISLSIENCTLRVVELKLRRNEMPIDHFFRSLAQDQGENVVGIILTGNGSDGTLGLAAIREHGGLTMVQSPDTAKFDSMPRSAIASGAADYVHPIELMPSRIIEYVRHLDRLRQRRGSETLQEEAAALLPKFFPLLRSATGHDFHRYKQSTLIRRIQRRVQILRFESVARYLERLEEDRLEIENLFRDLLIGVTQFFRDPDAFKALGEKVVPEIFQAARDRKVRIWVPGCATGEEAYSLAILCAEHLTGSNPAAQVQVFATDLDIEALEFARRGRYPAQVAEQVSPERLRRFFVKRTDGYELSDEIREMCVFSPHNLIKDPPFSRLDLISCRNVLIYFEADLQKRLLPVFHYALTSSGYLFLGPAENVAARSEMFHVLDKQHRIFQRKPSFLQEGGGHLPLIDPTGDSRVTLPPAPAGGAKPDHTTRTIERILLEEYAPPSVVVNDQGEVMYFSGRTGTYLEPQAGAPTSKLLGLVNKQLRLELRTLLNRAFATHKEVTREGVPLKVGRDVRAIKLVIRPLSEVGRTAGLYIVVFQENAPALDGQARLPEYSGSEHPALQQLENELRVTKEDLQTTIEELETSNEELKSANEELLSMNEELQSTNEELQTSKEELVSLNEELQRKVDEADAANTDLQNFLQATQITTVFVDRHLRLRRFTPALADLFPLRPSDVGKRITELAADLIDSTATHALENVFTREQTVEHHVFDARGQRWWMMRGTPYRTSDGRVEGAVISFTDITEMRRAHERQARLASLVENSDDAIVGKTLDGTITSWNRAAERIFGFTVDEMVGRSILMIIPPEKRLEEFSILERLSRGESVAHYETTRVRKDGTRIDVSLTSSPIRGPDGRIIGASKIARDITEQKQAREALREAQLKLAKHAEELESQVRDRTAHLRETIESLEALCYTMAHDLRGPLRAVQGFTQELIHEYDGHFDPEGKDLAQRIVNATMRMDRLITDLLTYARLSQAELPCAELDLGMEVTRAFETLAGEMPVQEPKLTVASLPRVIANQAVLSQILTNLIGNALKFVRPGTGPEVEIYAQKQAPDRLRVFIRDHGIGIPADQRERIFGLFQRLHQDRYPGTGVGLAIVKKGLERMGGSIGIDPSISEGTCFYFDLPCPAD